VSSLTRRGLIAGGLPLVGAGAALLHTSGARGHSGQMTQGNGHDHGGHANFRGNVAVDHTRNGFDPHEIVRDFDWGTTTRMATGRVVREWELTALDKEIEVMPGVTFAAWTYNGRIPGPTLRAREGELLRIRFVNGSEHSHTIHFHGIHPSSMDGVPGIGAGEIKPGGSTVYEFEALPAGLHLYHCHVRPLAEHIAKGLYGAFIIDPEDGREDADEMVMVMNGFDTNFDRANEVYAANTIGFAYMDRPLQTKVNELVRIYLVNVLEYDLINSFHLHGNLFDYYPTGTGKTPSELTDTVMLCQGQRGILEWRFPYPGQYMFHAHQSEFTELGWQGIFEVS
jgi:FtsP/CotA-like multicopper oxidase with cupredoxin domain